MILDLVLLILLTIAALWAVLRGSLLRAAIALAVTSVLVTVIMFRLQAPLAAVFELSVCAGLITVIFMSTISLTRRLTPEDRAKAYRERIRRFWFLPVLVAVVGVVLALVTIPVNIPLPAFVSVTDVRSILWGFRQLDLLGQVIILLAGVFGVMVLFKDKPKSRQDI